MLKIGEFARLAQVSIRLLRHYDEIGLIRPVRVDRESGYRYYSVEQLPRLNRILALKNLGLSLEQIGLLVEKNLSLDELRGMLLLKHAELRQHVAEEQARLEKVEERLHYIEQEGKLPEVEVKLMPLEALPVLSVCRAVTSSAQLLGLFREVYHALRDLNIASQPPIMGVYHTSYVRYHRLVDEIDHFLIEAAFAVPGLRQSVALSGGDQLKPGQLPGYKAVASGVYQGSDQDRGQAIIGMLRWMEAHGYTLAGPRREVYLHRDTVPANHITEILLPLRQNDS